MTDARNPSSLRSARWFEPDDLRSFGHRSRLKGMGFGDEDFRGKPVIGVLNTWSDLNTCHSHFRERAEDVKRGILQAGGFPVEVPVMSLGEMLMKPTTMLYRNMLAMEVEEVLRCHPIDAAVLMGGCDKTVPGLIMGALSADIPSVFLPAGPMLKAKWKKETLGSGSDAWKYWAERCAGNLCDEQWNGIENSIGRSAGTCMTMGTASTMACVAEAMGMSLPGAACIPAVLAAHRRLGSSTGRRAVELAWEQLKPSQIVTADAIHNGIVTQQTIGGSTNAIVHLLALARRAEVQLTMEDFDALSQQVPVLGDLRPSGKYLMEDFYDAGGLAALLWQLKDLLKLEARSVNGLTLEENIKDAEIHNEEVIRLRGNPLSPSGGTAVLKGNLAPDGCVIKTIAADPKFLKHRGKAVVFENYAEMKSKIDEPDLEVSEDSVLVLKSAGPLGAPGFPEWGMLPIPKKLLEKGVRDMVRISDARMSGTSYGTCVLHVSPESHTGGPFALVQTGDEIELDVEARKIHWHVTDEEIAVRQATWQPPRPAPSRGYNAMFAKHVSQAHEGCDFDFLEGRTPNEEPEIQ